MSLQIIKSELINLCKDLQDELPDNVADRIRSVRQKIIKSDQWIEKTAHIQLRALTALWNALSPTAPFEDVRWQVNVADGLLDQAINITKEEWERGIPKPLKPALSPESGQEKATGMWIDSVLDDGDFISNEELYLAYQEWMHGEEMTPLSSVSLGRTLKEAGFENSMKKIGGKVQRGWMIHVTPIID